MARKKIVAGNWKMHTDIDEGIALAIQVSASKRPEDVQVVLGVPFTHIAPIKKKITKKSKIKIAAQNCHHLAKGAYTGEISAPMLASLGVPYVILGHSERREHFGETNAWLALKIDAALAHGLDVIFCCGEPLDIRRTNNHIIYVKNQLEESLFHLTAQQMKHIVIAYEPIWAIGTGETASATQAQEMHSAIRSMLSKKYGKRVSENTSILYGGSVKGSNAKELFANQDVDGGLVGGASLNAQEFNVIINAFGA